MLKMQIRELFHNLVSNFPFDHYSFSCHEIIPKIIPKLWVFNSHTINIAQNQNQEPVGERTPNTACFRYRSWQDTIRTESPNLREKTGLPTAKFSGGNWPIWKGPSFSCGNASCNGLFPVPILTRNHSSGLEPLLILV